MGCSRSAIADDKDDLCHLLREAGVASTKWKVYSPEGRHAERGFKNHKLKGEHLIHYVDLMIQVDEVIARSAVDDVEYQEYQRLKKKYG